MENCNFFYFFAQKGIVIISTRQWQKVQRFLKWFLNPIRFLQEKPKKAVRQIIFAQLELKQFTEVLNKHCVNQDSLTWMFYRCFGRCPFISLWIFNKNVKKMLVNRAQKCTSSLQTVSSCKLARICMFSVFTIHKRF